MTSSHYLSVRILKRWIVVCLRFIDVRNVMSQSCQNLVRFPSTRLMNADYGSILPNVLQQVTDVIDKGDFSHSGHLPVPHQVISRSIDGNLSLSERVETFRHALVQQISSLERSIACQEQRIAGAEPVVKILLANAKRDPASAASAVCCSNNKLTLAGTRPRRRLLCAHGKECGKVTLPFSKYCLQHQCSDCEQLLYPICSGVDTNSLTRCNRTVLDIFSDISLCSQHSSEAAPNAAIKRKATAQLQSQLQSRTANKKVKLGVAKVMRERKGTVKVKLRADQKVSPLGATSAWSSNKTDGLGETEGNNYTAGPRIAPPPSKSLDELLSLGSSLAATLPKLDLLPLKADIGEIMMAGEDSSGDD